MSSLERQLETSIAYLERKKMNERALAVIPNTGEIVAVSEPALRFTPEQEQMIRDAYANGASPSEFSVLMEVAKARRLNPLLRQVHFVKRWDSQKEKNIWAAQVSIDGLRAIAERTRMYDGQDEPEFEYDKDGLIILARVKVYKKGVPRPFVGVARWSEYVQTKKGGGVAKFWSDMPFTMIAKCAEALAIRKAFPEDSGALYIPEEMMQADRVLPIEQQPPRISPHGVDEDEAPPPDAEAFEALLARLTTVESAIPLCKDYSGSLALRDLLGSKAKQSQLTRDIQAAKERGDLSPSQGAVLGKTWMRCDRQVVKLEAQFKPDLTDSFRDEEDTGEIQE